MALCSTLHIKNPFGAISGGIKMTIFGLVIAAGLFIGTPVKAADQTACPNGASLNIVAHADDDLIFMNPDIQRDIDNDLCVRTIVVTAGDAGYNLSYAEQREAGSRAAYAAMAGVADSWTTEQNFIVNGHTLWLYTLNDRPNISLVYMRINDGNIDGSGFKSTSYASLQKLWNGTIQSISSVDTIAAYKQTYTSSNLATTLAVLLESYAPDTVRSMDFLEDLSTTSDHKDHVATAYFTQKAERESINANRFVAYRGYPTSSLSANISGVTLDNKWNTLMTYAARDTHLCQTRSACTANKNSYGLWMARQYTRGTRNIASLATVTASSQDTGSGQGVAKAVDGSLLGYPADSSKEWSTEGERDGSWINLTWKSQQTINKVVLYDRPNENDHILSGTLTFSDGSTEHVGELFNNGAATVITFAPRDVTSVQFTVDSTSDSTENTGLAEIEAISTNIAGEATLTASSQASGQTAAKAADGYALGYPTDSTKEWSTSGGKAGSWLKLTWVAPRWVDRVTLFDRPNTNDRVLSGTLLFSNGTSVNVGNLPNNGAPLEVTLSTPILIQSVQFKVNSVSASTKNVGLSEIQVDDGAPALN